MEKSKYSIILIDDHPMIHDGLKTLLASEQALSIDATASSASEAIDLLATMQPDLAIVDLSMDDSDGTYLIQKIHNKFPDVRLLVYTMSEENLFGARVANAGAHGYVMKTSPTKQVKEAIYTILDGNLYFSPKLQEDLSKQEKGQKKNSRSILSCLTNREMDIFTLVGQGLHTMQISDKLAISRNTVDTHRINIRKKLTLVNGKALDRFAFEVVMKGRVPRKKRKS